MLKNWQGMYRLYLFFCIFSSWIFFFSRCICSYITCPCFTTSCNYISHRMDFLIVFYWRFGFKRKYIVIVVDGMWWKRIFTCCIYGSGKICASIWFWLGLDFNVFYFDCTRLILNEDRDLVCIIGHSLMLLMLKPIGVYSGNPWEFFCVATGNMLICQGKLQVLMPLRPPACVLFSCEDASKWCLFCDVHFKVCKENGCKNSFKGSGWLSSSPSSKLSSRSGCVIKKALLKLGFYIKIHNLHNATEA